MSLILKDYEDSKGVLDEKLIKIKMAKDTGEENQILLEAAYESLNKELDDDMLTIERTDQEIDALPFSAIKELLSEKTTNIQKRTAFKVLKRYFRNTRTQDFSQGVNFDYTHTQEKQVLQQQLTDKNEKITGFENELAVTVEKMQMQIGKIT